MKDLQILQNELQTLKNKIDSIYKNGFLDLSEEERVNIVDNIIDPLFNEIRTKEKEIESAKQYEVKVGDGITLRVYTDCHAYTIIKRTAKTITIQRDKATLSKNWRPERIAGGFAGHCVNNHEQTYDYERDQNGEVITIHWSEKRRRWNAPKGYSNVFLGRREFYDYNF